LLVELDDTVVLAASARRGRAWLVLGCRSVGIGFTFRTLFGARCQVDVGSAEHWRGVDLHGSPTSDPGAHGLIHATQAVRWGWLPSCLGARVERTCVARLRVNLRHFGDLGYLL
jgi:hypothetical protein